MLECELITNDHHDLELNETIYEYIQPSSETFYHFKLESVEEADEYSIKFSVFTGELQVGSYYDEEFKNKLLVPPAQYQSDLQFLFSK